MEALPSYLQEAIAPLRLPPWQETLQQMRLILQNWQGDRAMVRPAVAPTIPTMAESGLPGYASYAWLGFSAPAGTPKPVIDRLYGELNAVMQIAGLRSALLARGIEPMSLTPEASTKYVSDEIDKWKTLIKSANLQFE